MKMKRLFFRKFAFVLGAAYTLSVLGVQASSYEHKAKQILSATGVKGGLIVHIGCRDGKLTASLRANDRYVVHGLDTDPDAVAKARKYIQGLGLYGKVSVETLDGRDLPYADNLVNLLIAEDLGHVPMKECLRVLAPNGVAYVKSGSRWNKTVKPWPDEIDEWTHHLHDAGGNAVANDHVAGPPAHLQWSAGPLWARSHGWTPSVSAMVSADGRLFYICDETLTCVDGTVPSKWFVIARDAFSGVLLWKCPIPKWGSEEFSGTPNTGKGVTTGRFTMPPNVGKRLVAVEDTVYVTLGTTAPVTALDAATGEVKRVYAETTNADEILFSDGRLIMSINPSEKALDAAPAKHVCAVDIKTGQVLWKKGPFASIRASKGQDPFGRLELAAGDGKVFVLTTEAIECFDADSGGNIWQIDRPALPPEAVRRIGFAGMYEYKLTVMVYHDGVVLLAQPEPNTHHTYHTMPGTLYAFAAKDGRQMWKHAYGGWGHCTPPDVFVVGDAVWTHVDAEAEFGSSWGGGFRAKDPSAVDYRIQALDLRTGKLSKELSTKEIFNVGHHHRCYRNKITERFLLSCRRGVEFVDLSTGKNYQNHWVRGGCLLGYLPCNGMLYVTPHPCGCYITTKLTGFNALAPARKSRSEVKKRLEKGPVYNTIRNGDTETRIANNDWPTYRHDPWRSSATDSTIPTNLKITWQTDIGAKPSGLVVAGGKVLVSGVDTHTIWALDTDDGKEVWKYTVGSRVDSPPTLYNGLVIFGSADGRVYCLGAADGVLVWRFNAAPCHRLITVFGQLESPWPVPGSVLVHDGKCWFAAGRSSYLDGGIHIYALDPKTGKVVHHETIYSPDPETGKMSPETSANSMSGLLNDIPATDGADVFIRQMKVSSSSNRGGQHLYTSGGYLDPSWFNRTFWKVGRAQTSGLMVLGKDVAYGVEVYPSRSRETVFMPGAKAYRLRCIPLKAPTGGSSGKQATGKRRLQGAKALWEQRLDIRVTAMVRMADTIFVAGAPDVIDQKDPYGAWEGRKGGVLAAYAADDGKILAEYKLPALPVWDGIAAAGGRLFISTLDGGIICMGRRQENKKRL
ncbi:MAG: outer membrane protein assembly factor BamB family protein [Planctomycetota bacterium]|jgi:outer membrane protein assembly factor BamB